MPGGALQLYTVAIANQGKEEEEVAGQTPNQLEYRLRAERWHYDATVIVATSIEALKNWRIFLLTISNSLPKANVQAKATGEEKGAQSYYDMIMVNDVNLHCGRLELLLRVTNRISRCKTCVMTDCRHALSCHQSMAHNWICPAEPSGAFVTPFFGGPALWPLSLPAPFGAFAPVALLWDKRRKQSK